MEPSQLTRFQAGDVADKDSNPPKDRQGLKGWPMACHGGRAHPSIYEAMRPPWRGCIENAFSISRRIPSKYTTSIF